MKEQSIRSLPGIPMVLVLVAALLIDTYLIFKVAAAGTDFQAVAAHIGPVLLVLIGVGAVLLFCLGGLYMVEPNQAAVLRSEEHTSELQSLMRISYAVFCLKKKKKKEPNTK